MMNSKSFLIFCFVLLLIASSCKKENIINSTYTPLYLTDRVWLFDTLLINPPASYATLSDSAKYTYNVAKAWLKNARIVFNKDGSLTMNGDWDFGYTHWQLINNNADIEMTLQSGRDTLYFWQANSLQLTYRKSFENLFEATYKYK